MKIRLAEAYELLVKVEPHFADSTADTAELLEESNEADAELAEDAALFNSIVDRLREGSRTGELAEIDEALIRLRGAAMNLSTLFDNLVDEIERVGFSRSARE